MRIYKIFFIALLMFGFSACDLDEELREDFTSEEASDYLNESTDADALIKGIYDGLRLPFMDQSRFWALQQHTSDETLGPTRGPDWDDGGVWRVLHDHTWSADHSFMGDTFTELLQVVFTATNALTFEGVLSTQQQAEARFVRAFVMFAVADGWNQVPFREAGGNLIDPSEVLSGEEAVTLIASELDAIQNDLPTGPANIANQDAARVLKMKLFLNKGTFANRSAPTFDAADMQQVITLADQIIGSGSYTLEDSYFDNFAPNNDAVSSENIWTGLNEGGTSSGNVRSRWFCTLHYNQNPSGWNGFTTLSDFYDSFEAGDVRAYTEYPGIHSVGGINNGFLIGQQTDQTGADLQDRKGFPLSFTRDVALIESGDNLEVTGIRVIKYPIDYNSGDNADNDYVFFRYADVLLMKAEALLRTGDAAGALTIVNDIRTARGASALGSLDEATLLAERGRELYWEGWRRQDMIRFGAFLDAWQEKAASGEERLLFPIPATQLAVNPNLAQNPGY